MWSDLLTNFLLIVVCINGFFIFCVLCVLYKETKEQKEAVREILNLNRSYNNS